jgi:hypothetical protein
MLDRVTPDGQFGVRLAGAGDLAVDPIAARRVEGHVLNDRRHAAATIDATRPGYLFENSGRYMEITITPTMPVNVSALGASLTFTARPLHSA